ncbi:hypothetical protein EIN_155010 [Entamoeba invadens IP1]|uniref:Uncharacterized protein n=1 Tax=Entamoeba invadens IP1 TaxID=370355 RepID=A0A0A1U941_ENTIV|nr:hypothetical protein EIN_155010 [Entamoeba invadens IP1]ELP91404.1 hypothetical protein EIN_155010 [Entamoeba invadens IP1]|eukprot:XP_004258175.1 hypothetical protein EIN_155010 [Entamoeba invadens IP1]
MTMKSTKTFTTKISESRTKKALSTASLILFSLNQDAKIKFNSTKESNYAEKVFIGEEFKIEGKVYTRPDFLKTAYLFNNEMHNIIKEAKRKGVRDVTVNYNMLRSMQNSVIPEVKEDQNSKVRNKNREAAFSNFLAVFLLERGFTLVTSTKKMKMSSKTIQFYAWAKIIPPVGNSFSVNENKKVLADVLKGLKNFISVFNIPPDCGSAELLCNIEQQNYLKINRPQKTPSAFQPSKVLFQVI